MTSLLALDVGDSPIVNPRVGCFVDDRQRDPFDILARHLGAQKSNRTNRRDVLWPGHVTNHDKAHMLPQAPPNNRTDVVNQSDSPSEFLDPEIPETVGRVLCCPYLDTSDLVSRRAKNQDPVGRPIPGFPEA